MSAEDNKVTMRRLYEEVINTGDHDRAEEFIAPDMYDHDPSLPENLRHGTEGFKYFFSMAREAFPDLQFTIEDMIAEGEKVVTRFTLRGTQEGEFLGMAPTGKRVEVTGIDITRFSDGKMVEHWANTDDLGMMQQLGAVPEPGEQEGVKPSH
jgi:steroid delta-isomerase-like uncharacterized protein